MPLLHWILLSSFGVFVGASAFFVAQVISSTGLKDPAEIRGNSSKAILYSLTGAMSPLKKESARRHIPTYVMGLVFHAGVFLAFAWLALRFFDVRVPAAAARASAAILILTGSVGLGLFVKRVVRAKLRYFSTFDDYLSNALVVGFEIITAFSLINAAVIPASFVYASVLLLYMPVGKLRHAVYFPLARIYLGFFYGRRGVWGAGRRDSWETQNR